MDYSKIREMLGEIEQEQHRYCKFKEEYLIQYRSYDVEVRSYEHRAALAEQSRETYLQSCWS